MNALRAILEIGGTAAFVISASKPAGGGKELEFESQAQKELGAEPAASAGGRGVRGGKGRDRSQQGIDDQLHDISKNQVKARKIGQGETIRDIKKSQQNEDHKNSRIKSSKDIENQ